MKDPPWGLKTEKCSICYVSLLEGTHNFWKLQENCNLDSTLQGILMYWPMHVLRQQQFLPLLGHLHSHLMVKLWCNWGSHGFHTDWFLLGVTWSLAKLSRAFESWVLVSVLLQETIRPVWVRTAKKSFSVENMWYWHVFAHFQNYSTPIVLKYTNHKNCTTPPDSQHFDPRKISRMLLIGSEKVSGIGIPKKIPVGMMPAKRLSISEGLVKDGDLRLPDI